MVSSVSGEQAQDPALGLRLAPAASIPVAGGEIRRRHSPSTSTQPGYFTFEPDFVGPASYWSCPGLVDGERLAISRGTPRSGVIPCWGSTPVVGGYRHSAPLAIVDPRAKMGIQYTPVDSIQR
jgi:hypothetical protein